MAWPNGADAGWLTPVRDAVVLDVVDPTALAEKVARALHPAVGLSFTGVAIRGESGIFAMHGVAGGRNEAVLRQIRLSSGQGLGGKVVALREAVLVTDYVTDPAITPHFRDLAVLESLGGMAAVPVITDDEVTAIIYAATRDDSHPGDVGLTRLNQAAVGLSDLFGTAVHHQDALRRQAAAERLRIAEELHDTVGQVLFSIGASARRLRSETDGLPNLAQLSQLIEGNAARATGMLRDALCRLTPRAPEESLPVAARLSVEEFSRASGIPAHLVVVGTARTITCDGAGALVNVVREGLQNVAKHAGAGRVVVTLAYSADTVEVAIQDDGRGLPPRFVLKAIAGPGSQGGFGLPSLLRRMQQLGGTLTVRSGPEGGTVVRAALHHLAGGSPPSR
jgi:LuxR family transcriptional regulator, regulator of acetate metabolism